MCKDGTVRALCSVTLGRLITILCWGAYIAAMAAEATAQAIVVPNWWILHYQSVLHCV